MVAKAAEEQKAAAESRKRSKDASEKEAAERTRQQAVPCDPHAWPRVAPCMGPCDPTPRMRPCVTQYPARFHVPPRGVH
eukprot:5260300-Prymnesium_polylepis.1